MMTSYMRTTVTIDSDLEQRLKKMMHERGIGFKQALNDVLRRGLIREKKRVPYRVEAVTMGLRTNHEISLRLSDSIEDLEILRKLELRK